MSDWPRGLTLRPIEAWPGEYTKNRDFSRFKANLSDTLQQLDRELYAIGAKNVVMQIAMREEDFRIDGRPRAQAKALHPGVILSMETRAGALSFPCDTYRTWQENLRAITLTMEKLRAIDRYGVTKRGEQYRGWKAIESTAMPASFDSAADAIKVLWSMVSSGPFPQGAALRTPDDLRRMLRRAQQATHPDSGGDRYRWERVAAAESYLRSAGRL